MTNKILSRHSNFFVNVVIWLKLGNSSISMREIIITLVLERFDQKNHLFWGKVLIQANNLGLALGMALKFHTIVAKMLKLKVKKFLELIPTFVEVTGEKLVGELPPS